MKKLVLALFVSWYVAAPLVAQTLSPISPALQVMQPQNIFPVDAGSQYVFSDRSEGKSALFTVAAPAANNPVFTAENIVPSNNNGQVQTTWKSSSPVKRGDVLLARFAIRSLYAKQESGEAIVYFFMNQAVTPFERSIILAIGAGPEWKTIDIPFEAASDMAAGDASIGFTFAALAQKVEITSVQLLNFENKANIGQLPITRFTYQGREANAAWRKDALKRIEVLRTAPLVIKVVDSKGKPVTGATVKATLVQPEFIWGTAVNERMLANDGPDSDNYKKLLKELFNTAVIENGLKAGVWSGHPERKEETLKGFEWLQQQNFRQRGHNLVWPGFKFNPALFRQTAETDSAKFNQIIEADIRSKMAVTKGKVIAWDVINELLHEKDFFKYLPAGAAVRWFKLAKELDPNAQLFINEYAMLNSIVSPKNIQEYIDTIASLRRAGAPIEALGVQGHVGRQPRNPAQVITDLDLFKPLGLPVQITEFDINSPDEELQADYTRDFLIACYSHPVITGFNKWGFWQGAHWKPDAAMFRKDWTAKPNAAVWREWVTGKWKTNLATTVDKKGEVNSRGHFGKYEITVTKGGKTTTTIYQLTKNAAPASLQL